MVKLEEAIKTTKFSSEKHKAGINLLYTSWWLKTIINRELKKFGLTNEQFNVLRILKGKHPEEMCVRDIASRMIERNSNVPRIIDRLVLKKLVNRSTSVIDKRETMMGITEQGVQLLVAATEGVDKVFADTVCINEQEAQQLNEFLELMRTA